MKCIDTDVRRYLHETLGADFVISASDLGHQLPYFLKDAFDYRGAEILGARLVLAIERQEKRIPGRDLRKQLARVAADAGVPVVYVVNSLASHERRRLVEQRIPFIVPGNQLYLPTVGIDFREHFRRRPQLAGKPLSPATQAILVAALMRKQWIADWAPEVIAKELGYGPMTTSRAVQELKAERIATLAVRGRRHLLRFDRPPASIWNDAKPVLRSPIKRSVWAKLRTNLLPELEQLPAGQSALARYSMISEPTWPSYAVSAPNWTKRAGRNFEIVPEPEPGASEWQIWSYPPKLAMAEQTAVDPLSLTLSMQNSTDERIQIALDELQERFPWSEG
jgi:hypothetical protein